MEDEIKRVASALAANGYSAEAVKQAIRKEKTPKEKRLNKNPTTATFSTKAKLPYMRGITDRIGKILKKHNNPTVYLPTKK